MATYYKWRKSTIKYTTRDTSLGSQKHQFTGVSSHTLYYVDSGDPTPNQTNGTFDLPRSTIVDNDDTSIFTRPAYFSDSEHPTSIIGSSETKGTFTASRSYQTITLYITSNYSGNLYKRESIASPNSLVGYVYSTSSSAYPNGGVQDGYYYDQRTTVESPAAPTGLTYPAQIVQTGVDLSWTAAGSNTDYPVSEYEVSYSTNGGSSWTVAGTTANTSYSFAIPAGTLSIQFRVRAKDSNGQWGNYVTATASQVIPAPDLTAPQMVMQGQPAVISWSSIDGADSYTLQRKSSADADWTQVYSGPDTTFTETVGTWTSLQYRVQAVFGETAGGWATSDPIQIVSASTLVISGQDGDLGTLTSDVPYSISSDQASPTIDVTVEVNGGEYTSFTATSGQTYKVGVLDLPTGTGSIVITATTEVSSSPVSVTRTWTYSKTDISFPDNGSVAGLTQEGATIWSKTLDEAVRTGMNPWGGNLSTALNLLKNAALFNRTKQAKYSEVTIDLSTLTQTDAQNGKIINLPVNGVMVPHRVVHIGNPDPELYDASCDGVWLFREDIYASGGWNTTDNKNLSGSIIMSSMQSQYDGYDNTIKNSIKTVKIPYYYNDSVISGASGLSCKLFPLSCKEVGLDNRQNSNTGKNMVPQSGARLSYFSDVSGDGVTAKRAASDSYWLRDIVASGSGAWFVSASGSMDTDPINTVEQKGYRYCMILPSTFSATYYVDQGGGIHASQEYTEAGDWLDVWGKAIPAVKIEAGSYVGTGTSGSSNPTSLTFSFEPKMVFISSGSSGDDTSIYWTLLQNGIVKAPSVYVSDTNMSNAIQGYLINVSWTGNSVSFYGVRGGTVQLNMSGVTYHYVAIG